MTPAKVDQNHADEERWAQQLHAEHVREFTWMGGDRLTGPVLVKECGNCQRWGRYAAAAARRDVPA